LSLYNKVHNESMVAGVVFS